MDVAEQQKQTYNGWSNRETWLANLWLTNDQASYATLLQAYREGLHDYEHADWLKGVFQHQLQNELPANSVWYDLLYSALCQVNWLEVIENNRELTI